MLRRVGGIVGNGLGWLSEKPEALVKLEQTAKGGPDAAEGADRAAAEAADGGGKPTAHLTLEAGGAKATGTLSLGEGEKKKEEKKDEAAGGIAADVLKAAGALAAGITATGFVILVGAALFWFRFDEVGLPATQAVGLLSRNELLIQGAQEVAIYLGIALVGVVLVFFADRKGEINRLTLGLLVLLAAVAVGYLFLGTDIAFCWTLVLAAGVVFLLIGCIVVGRRTDERFWPLALAVFVATLIFAGAVSIFIVREQDYVQAVAVLRGADDLGLTGVYVTATDDTIYLGRVVPPPADGEPKEERRQAIFDVPRAGATYAVGPLEEQEKAAERAEAMLLELIADRERVKPPAAGTGTPSAPSDAPAGEASAPDAAKGAKEAGKQPAGGDPGDTAGKTGTTTPPLPIETVLEAFGTASVTIHDGPLEQELCLVRYADASKPRLLGPWWTSCAEARKLDSVGEIREKLALPGRFQPAYDARIEAIVPKGTEITYVEGPVAKQCEHDPAQPCGREYLGGGLQYYLPEPGKAKVIKKECATTREDESPNWEKCAA